MHRRIPTSPGKLTIHEASATPGSSFASLLQVVDLLRKRDETNGLSSRSLTLPEQTVPVQVRQGYVIHDGLMMDLAGYRLKSTGAVGMNEQLQITLDVPLEKGTTGRIRTIKVPLRGTVKSPQLDTSSLIQNLGIQKIQEQLGTDKLQQKIGDEIDQTLNKGIEQVVESHLTFGIATSQSSMRFNPERVSEQSLGARNTAHSSGDVC